MRHTFEQVIIIYNPNSTGGASKDAEKLKTELEYKASDIAVTLKETQHAGHAEEIGAAYAEKDEPVLLISASGDGGYNELVNGVMQYPSKNVVVTVLPSGNANDHYEATKTDQSMLARIVSGKTRMIDLLSVEAIKDGQPWRRYAHSYVGIGVTAYIGEKLSEADLNPIKEKWLLLKYLIRFGHVTATVGSEGRSHRYSSIVVANTDRMSKVIRLDVNSRIDDGIVELYETRARSTLGLLLMLMSSRLISLKPTKKLKSIRVKTKKTIKIQCDGEVTLLNAGIATVKAYKNGLRILN